MRSRKFFGHEVIMLSPEEAAVIMPILTVNAPMALVRASIDPETNRHDVYILCNEFLGTLDKEYQEAIIAHEIGHIKLGHVSRQAIVAMSEQNPTEEFPVIPQFEFDADMYAARMGYAEPFLKVLMVFNKYGSHELLRARIDRLQSYLFWEKIGLPENNDYNSNYEDEEC